MEKSSVYVDGEQEALRFKWIESEKAGCDLGEAAIRRWVQCHWWGYLRARWLEHLQGKRFWVELDRGDFGLLQRKFHDNTLLLDRILDRLKAGQENLDIICWAQTGASPSNPSCKSSKPSTSTAADSPIASIPKAEPGNSVHGSCGLVSQDRAASPIEIDLTHPGSPLLALTMYTS